MRFLRTEAAIPHIRLLPYTHTFPVLVRFVRLRGEPSDRLARLLRRWVWRDAADGIATGGRSVATIRKAVRSVGSADPYAAAAGLLDSIPNRSAYRPDLEKVHLNHASAKVNLLGLVAAGPLSLDGGAPLDVAAAFDTGNPVRAILPRDNPSVPSLIESFANRIIATHGSTTFTYDDDLANRDHRVLGQTFEDDPGGIRSARTGLPAWFANLSWGARSRSCRASAGAPPTGRGVDADGAARRLAVQRIRSGAGRPPSASVGERDRHGLEAAERDPLAVRGPRGLVVFDDWRLSGLPSGSTVSPRSKAMCAWRPGKAAEAGAGSPSARPASRG